VIAPDLLGHGYSDRRDRFDRSLVAQMEATIALLDLLEIETISFVGHDTGGGVALMTAIEHPERVDRLVLSNIVAFDSWPIDDMIALGNPEWKDRPAASIVEFIASGLPDGIHNAERLTDEFSVGIVAPYSDELGKISLIRNASSLNTNHTTALIDRHREIEVQTLLLWGVHDPWQTVGDAERLEQQIPASTLQRVEASHWIPWDAPVEFARGVLEFLSGSEPD
jgi:pimeloyl-ACP methyl ester carboxylesterase